MQRESGQFAEAAATYGRAIQRLRSPSRDAWTLYYGQGMSYDRAHQWPQAEAAFLRALELSPDQPYVLNYLGYAWTEQGRNLTRARKMIERAVEEQPNDGSIVDSLGWVLLQAGDKAGAIRFLERAVELEPEDSTINGHLGDAYFAAGRKQEADVQWRRALILHPDPQEALQLQAKLGANGTAPVPVAAQRRLE
jgi:Flp pilus assembly protein TadD